MDGRSSGSSVSGGGRNFSTAATDVRVGMLFESGEVRGVRSNSEILGGGDAKVVRDRRR